MSFPHSTCSCTCQRPDTGRTANDQWFHSDVCVWDSLGWWAFRRGSKAENRTLWPSSSPGGHWDLTPAILPHAGGMACLQSVFQSCIVQDAAVGCAQVHVCACEKVQIWRAVSNEVSAAAPATCVLGSSVWVSVKKSHHGSVASRTSVLLSSMSSRRRHSVDAEIPPVSMATKDTVKKGSAGSPLVPK